jgi:hypothetical protein
MTHTRHRAATPAFEAQRYDRSGEEARDTYGVS